MSHSTDHIICPNCGSEASGNYCFQCGQENHLHKENFIGLIMHFVSHYFHYDSKFWKTMNALWLRPGRLTLAYWNRQRMRYIPPISLYIFISAVYFFVSFSFDTKEAPVARNTNGHRHASVRDTLSDATSVIAHRDAQEVFDTIATHGQDSLGIANYISAKTRKIKAEHGDVAKYFIEQFKHSVPKLFFFMIPIMAFALYLLFVRRKALFFVDHAVFSLHYHSFWFSIMVFDQFPLSDNISLILQGILYTAVVIYMVAALRNVYGISRGRAVFYMFVIAIFYMLMFGMFSIVDAMLILAAA